MPQFDMKCKQCKHVYEFFKCKSDEEPRCPNCASPDAEKLPPTKTGFQLKGDGWAKDRYSKK